MGFSLIGLILLSAASSYWMILCASAFVGLGSSVFHPEASRLARMASGGRYGFAQSLFRVGGNAGQSLGPLLAALVVGTRGQSRIGLLTAFLPDVERKRRRVAPPEKLGGRSVNQINRL